MENEIMNYEEIEVMDDMEMAEDNSGIGAGIGMLIGAGLTLALGAGIKLGKNLYAKYKANKGVHKPEHEIQVEPEDVEAVAAK